MKSYRMAALILVFAALLLTTTAHADGPKSDTQPDAAPNTTQSVELEELEVIATPIIQGNEIDRYGATSTVVSEEQMDKLGALDLSSALRRTPGVTISRHNPVGAFGGGEGGAVFIRGMGSSRPGSEIKTFIDGVPAYMGVWNHPLIDLLPVDPIESIEVLKGPQPNRFGDALSIINIVPKRMRGDDFTTTIEASAGSYGTISQSLEHGGRIGEFDYYMGQGFRRSDGHREDADGRQFSLFGNLGVQLNQYWDVRLFALNVDNEASDPGPDDNSAAKEGSYETRMRLASLTFSNDFDMAHGEIKFFANAGEGYWRDQAGADDDCLNDFWFWGLKAREQFNITDDFEITVGLDQQWWDGNIRYTYDNGTDDSVLAPSFALTMPYASTSYLIGETDGWHIIPSVGVRQYEHNKFDSRTAPHAGLVAGYGSTEVHASMSKGISYPGHDVVILFPTAQWQDIEPEEVEHVEVGISHTFQDLFKIDLTYFHDDGQDRYVFTLPPFPPTWSNTEEFEIEGFEASLSVTPTPDLSLFTGLTIQNSTPGDMPYVPETTVSGGFNWQFLEDFNLSMDCEYVSDMYALKQVRKAGTSNTEKVDDHFLVNARLGWTFFLDDWDAEGELYLSVQNITDEDYEYKPNYPMPGTNGMVGVKLTF
ncbi:TonB-dependent receptor, plug [Desulfovibrio ferrophilus]|uniref:TonB-dependent receptor, plug n=2 Tax=Desulfovibrio ferrophilus TaxID=241368 RepID=A0A2Z6B331_9BACT|nr:TonB-dependent receptor, plug [Desulfovibrio ferrophilus]